jgi:anti-sigma factor RsiW
MSEDVKMTCEEARAQVATARRPRVDPPELAAHLAECEACRLFADRERETTQLLRDRLPRHAAPGSLRRAVAAQLGTTSPRPLERPRTAPPGARRTGLFVIAAVALAFVALTWVRGRRSLDVDQPLVTEAVNDHLRVLVRERPLDIESSDNHQVKPWFAGKLDFAPILAFGGDADFPLRGGAVGWFVDRKAATFVFERRLHVITLLVFRGENLPWSSSSLHPIGRLQVQSTTTRGYHVLLWRDGDLGYALVSDVDEKELETLAGKLGG